MFVARPYLFSNLIPVAAGELRRINYSFDIAKAYRDGVRVTEYKLIDLTSNTPVLLLSTSGWPGYTRRSKHYRALLIVAKRAYSLHRSRRKSATTSTT